MPVSVRSHTFQPAKKSERTESGLRIPQARILRALMTQYPDDPPSEWPILNRAALSVKAGYTAISGTTTRALNGIHPGSSSGDAHPGLLARGLVVAEDIDVEGTIDTHYRITAAGIKEFQAFVAAHGDKLPPLRDAASCVNTSRGYDNPHLSPT